MMRSRWCIVIALVGMLCTATAANAAVGGEPERVWVDSVFDALSAEERLAQLFLLHTTTTTPPAEMAQQLGEHGVGGILLTPLQEDSSAGLRRLTQRYQVHAPLPLEVAIRPYWSEAREIPTSLAMEGVTDATLQQHYAALLAELRLESGATTLAPPKGIEGDSTLLHALFRNDTILTRPTLPLSQLPVIQRGVAEGKIAPSTIENSCLAILAHKYRTLHAPKETATLPQREVDRRVLLHRLWAASVAVASDALGQLPYTQLDQRSFALLEVGSSTPTPFAQMLQHYLPMAHYPLDGDNPMPQVAAMERGMEHHNTLIIALHTARPELLNVVKEVCYNRQVTVVSFVDPRLLSHLLPYLSPHTTLLHAYSDHPLAQESAAQLLFGGMDRPQAPAIRLGYALPEEVEMCSDTLQRIDEIVAKAIAKEAMPGCQVLVARRGKVIYHKAFGYFDYAQTHPVTLDDLYDLASVTKATATLPMVMQLVDREKLDLEARMANYLPQLQGSDKSTITLRSALYHESGLPSSLEMNRIVLDPESYAGSPLYSNRRTTTHRTRIGTRFYAHSGAELRSELFRNTPQQGYTLPVADSLYALNSLPDTLLQRVVDGKLYSRSYRYSCLNFMLLKRAAEQVSGESIDHYLYRHFTHKLGAERICYNPLSQIDRSQIAPTEHDELLRHQIIVGHPHDEIAAFSGGIGGNAGLFANANDLAKLLQMYLNGGEYGGERFIEERTIELFAQQKSAKSRRTLGFDKPDARGSKYSPTCEEASTSVYGHTGYTGTAFWIDPKEELLYIFLTNRIYPNRWNSKLTQLNVRTDIQSVLYHAIYSK